MGGAAALLLGERARAGGHDHDPPAVRLRVPGQHLQAGRHAPH